MGELQQILPRFPQFIIKERLWSIAPNSYNDPNVINGTVGKEMYLENGCLQHTIVNRCEYYFIFYRWLRSLARGVDVHQKQLDK